MGRPCTILVVEDTLDLLRMLEHLLISAGYLVKSAANGAEAFKILRMHSASLDVLICDWKLPDADGNELAALARDLNPGMGILLMSGAGESNESTDPSICRMTKPFSGRQLLDQVRLMSKVHRNA